MQLLIDRERREFLPIATFRAAYNLPYTFGISHFEPADRPRSGWGGDAEAELAEVQQAVLDAMPAQLPVWGWSMALPPLVTLFQNKLDAAAPLLDMSSREVAFAVNTFSELCQKYLHAVIRARVTGQPFPVFGDVYTAWLESTVEIGGAVHPYVHQGGVWAVQVVSHAYGKAGLVVWTDTDTYYIEDNAQRCPAQPFMEALLTAVAGRIARAVQAAPSAPPAASSR